MPAPTDRPAVAARPACFHCGEPCLDPRLVQDDKPFCCQGCLVVHDLLTASGLGHFYDLNARPGVRIRRATKQEQHAHLDDPALQERLLDFTDGRISRVTLSVPQIHCVACVWLLENLFQLHPGIGRSQVNFTKREVAITFAPAKLKLSELVALLASIGYEPQLTLGELEPRKRSPARQRQYLQVGVAGFAFGNIMLFSIPQYFGLDSFSGPLLRVLFGYLSLALALPVLVYSAADYWRSALLSVRQRVLTLDVPIAAGLGALYLQSAFEIVSGRGEGYLDSLAGLVFFLLCGKFFQQMTHDRLAFDRDYKCFFPLSVVRLSAAGEESIALSNLRVGDRLRVRHGELVPADARLLRGAALVDYSFVTGESEAVAKEPGAYLYAGGKQAGEAIEVEIVKPVSQSYLTSLWDHETFRKERDHSLNTLTNRYSRRFTRIVLAVALGAGLFWWASASWTRALRAFTSVLIVACPCALALAAPFTLGTAQRALARRQIFLKNALVLERLAQVDTIVFDKTGTLTAAANEVTFEAVGESEAGLTGALDGAEPGRTSNAQRPTPNIERAALEVGRSTSDVRGSARSERGGDQGLTAEEAGWVASLAGHSTHPHAVCIAEWCARRAQPALVQSFHEMPGAGIEGVADGHAIWLGSRSWLASRGIEFPNADGAPQAAATGSEVWLAIAGRLRGAFRLAPALRPDADNLLGRLGGEYEVALLSGDNARALDQFRLLLGEEAQLRFNQPPLAKLEFVRQRQEAGQTVMMVGDGLNDAGALRQSDVGVAVVERVGAFSPASDVILAGARVPQLGAVLRLARQAVQIVRVSFGISAAYNLVGVSIAAAGFLSPAICAILMPLSSFTVVAFACGATDWAARRAGLDKLVGAARAHVP